MKESHDQYNLQFLASLSTGYNWQQALLMLLYHIASTGFYFFQMILLNILVNTDGPIALPIIAMSCVKGISIPKATLGEEALVAILTDKLIELVREAFMFGCIRNLGGPYHEQSYDRVWIYLLGRFIGLMIQMAALYAKRNNQQGTHFMAEEWSAWANYFFAIKNSSRDGKKIEIKPGHEKYLLGFSGVEDWMKICLRRKMIIVQFTILVSMMLLRD